MPVNRAHPSWTVSEITRQIKSLFERGFRSAAIVGELSNVHRHSSGHVYFTLKDEHAQIAGVIWRSRDRVLSFDPQEGMQVVATGRITVYEARGVYQLEVSSMRPVGIGELARLFEMLKQQLAAEGLFDVAKKKALPRFPEVIGLITSPTGAALHDIVSIINRRFPGVKLLLQPVHVQGPSAAPEMARAIRSFNRDKLADVLILGRGGGSLEDLWPFNEEKLARAIAASDIPIVSAVGHEIDFTIADFVADARAATPSAAAEMVVPDATAILENLHRKWYLLHDMTERMLERHRETIRNLTRSHAFSSPPDLLRQYGQRLDEVCQRLDAGLDHGFSLSRSECTSLQKRIRALDPSLTLKRGYAMAMREGRPVMSAAGLEPGTLLDVRFYSDGVRTVVRERL